MAWRLVTDELNAVHISTRGRSKVRGDTSCPGSHTEVTATSSSFSVRANPKRLVQRAMSSPSPPPRCTMYGTRSQPKQVGRQWRGSPMGKMPGLHASSPPLRCAVGRHESRLLKLPTQRMGSRSTPAARPVSSILVPSPTLAMGCAAGGAPWREMELTVPESGEPEPDAASASGSATDAVDPSISQLDVLRHMAPLLPDRRQMASRERLSNRIHRLLAVNQDLCDSQNRHRHVTCRKPLLASLERLENEQLQLRNRQSSSWQPTCRRACSPPFLDCRLMV